MAEQENQVKPTLVELNTKDHGALKMDPLGAVKVAETQHVINLKVSEVGMAVSSFPVFLSKPVDRAEWTLSAVNSLELGKNLFVEDGLWTATHVPIGMQTFPFFLMRKDGEDNNFTIGINPENDVFSEEEGDFLFDENGKASIRLSQATAQLEVEIKNDIHTYQFANKLEELGLIKDVDLLVQYQGGMVNTLKGMSTINEEALMELSSEDFDELRKAGYIAPIYSMLTSIYQFNNLIQRHNKRSPNNLVAQVKIEVPSDDQDVS